MSTMYLHIGLRALGWLAAGCLLAAGARADDDERKAGDTCASAFQLDGPLPTSVSGTTAGFSNNYDEACPYADSVAPDVVYRYTPSDEQTVDILLCLGSTDFDTKLYVYDSCPPVAGAALACNDDACSSDTGQGFVSTLLNLPMNAGTTYYIVVDGYSNAAGNYTLTMRASLPSPGCADDRAVIFGQDPALENWTLAFSDLKGTPYSPEVRYDNFWGLTGRIATAKFWGLMFRYQPETPDGGPGYWDQCYEDPMDFELRFYGDEGGRPGAEVFAETVQLSGTLVGHVGYGMYNLYEYTAVLGVPLLMQSGWVSIAGAGGADCWFAWMNSSVGDQLSCAPPVHSYELFREHFDLAFCLITDGVPVYGACCDDALGVCQENVAWSDCPGRFMPEGSCADLDPPCGMTGACYHGGDCVQVTESDCRRMCAGDLNCDGVVDFGDINPFVLALSNPGVYLQTYPDCRLMNADCNGDGTTNLGDINPFITLVGTACAAVTWAGPGFPCAPWEWGQDPPVIYSYEIPYEIADSTHLRQDYFQDTCLAPFDRGKDRVYALVIEGSAMDVQIQLAPFYMFYTGMLLSDHYPPDGDCMAMRQHGDSNAYSLGCVHLEPGTYYLMVSNWPPPDAIDSYELSITTCVPDAGRCCYDAWTQCAVVTEVECNALGGVWAAGLDCTAGCPPRFREDCANAEVIPAVPFSEEFYSDAMTADGPAAPCDKYGPSGEMQNDAWIAWTADTSGLAEATAVGAYDAVLVVWDACGASTPLHCADDGPSGDTEVLRFWVAAGTTYYFQVGTAGNHPTGGWSGFTLAVAETGGACCLPDGTCQLMEWGDCLLQGGMFQADQPCTETTCPAQAGDDCATPITIALAPDALPYLETNWTTGHGNRYANTCLGSFDSGEDIVYELLVTQTVVVNITLDPMGSDYTGIALSDHCPPTNCIAKSVNAGTAPYGLKYIVLRPGVYYLMIDRWLKPSDIPGFTLTIENADMDLGACCRNGECVASTMLAECLEMGGAWHRNEPCDSTACESQPGDTCSDPLVVELTPYLWYEDWFNTCDRSNTYAGTTCLGTYDGGKEILYKLVVLDTDVVVNIELGGPPEMRMAIFDTCPPTESCLATAQYWYDRMAIRDLVLSPGVHYLMIDLWPQWSAWSGSWIDCTDASTIQIESSGYVARP